MINYRNKKAFTLLELLAVIIILAVIALITTPIVLNVIESSKKQANKNSVYGLIDGAKLYYAESMLDENKANKLTGKYNLFDEIKVSGNKPNSGVIYINNKGEISISVVYDKTCYTKNFNESDLSESNDIKNCVPLIKPNEFSISSTNITKNSISLNSKTTVKDDTITKYEYYLDGNLLSDLSGEDETINNLTPFTEYEIYVVAYYNGTPRRSTNTLKVTTEAEIHGVRRLITSTSLTWERVEDSKGLVANAQIGTTKVKNDFDSIYPWSDIISYNYDATTSKITAYYGDSNFKFDGTNGDVLTKIPEFYYKRVQENGYEYIYISKKRIDGYEKSEEFSIGRYTISGSSSRVYSRSGHKPLTDNISNFRKYARNIKNSENKSEFGIMDWHYFILQILYLVEYADYDSQAKLGKGYTNNTSTITSGGCDSLGMKSGSISNTGKVSMIYRGIEDIYGNIWQAIDGINVRDHKTYICKDFNIYASETFNGCYKEVGYVNASSNGYVNTIGYDPTNSLVMIPTGTTNSGLHIDDYYYQAQGDNRVAYAGGRFDILASGLWTLALNGSSSNVNTGTGARLIKYN